MNIPLQAPVDLVLRRFGAILSPRVHDATERRRHAALMAVLVGTGLVAALGMPLAGFAVGGLRAPILAAMLSGFCLLLAGFLAVSGAFEAVVGGAVAGATVFVASAAVVTGGIASPLVWLLPMAGAGGALVLRGRYGLACLAIASLGLAFVFGASGLERASGTASPREWMFVGTCTLAFASLVAPRARRRASKRAPPPAAAIETAETKLFRFAPGGDVVDASDHALAWFGDRVADERLPFALSIVHVADRVRFLSACGDVREGAASAECHVRLLAAGGEAFRETGVTLRAARTTDGRREIVMTAAPEAAGAALSDTVDLEAALGEAQAASLAKSRFLAMVSHELRTPLNAIIGFSDVLDREMFGGFPDPRQKEYVGLIRQSGEHLLSVVNGLLDVSKIEAGHYELNMEEFAVAEVLEAVAATVRTQAQAKGLRFLVANRCVVGRMTGDRRAVYQILLNLAANAVKFTDTGVVEIAACESDGFLRLTVSDTGIGIAPADIPRLGQPFVQASAGSTRRYEGTGLGLSLAKGFAELHRGSLRVSSEIGRGTEVEVLLSLDCTSPARHNDAAEQKVVTLKHARSQEAHSAIHQARRSA